MKRSLEATLVEHCAPTLAGVKPANLFLYRTTSGRQNVRDSANALAQTLAPYGITLRILKECSCKSYFLIYVCREAWVKRIVAHRLTASFLRTQGYDTSLGFEQILSQLSERLCLEQEFPHEIGIFLGYPLFDVISFMENKGRNYAFCGYWKAYDDPAGARKRTDQYRKCSLIYKRMFENGTPILRLIVAA